MNDYKPPPPPQAEILSFGIQYRDGQHRGPAAPAFCRSCGRPMRVTREPRRYDPFDAVTGEPQFEFHARCSRPRWSIGPFHDHAVQDEQGDWDWL